MVLKSIYFLPHGGVIVPGMESNRNKKAEILHSKMLEIKKGFEEDQIDLVFLTSPHGYTHPTDFYVYFHDIFEGWHFYRDEESEKSVEQLIFRGNTQIAQIFYQMLIENGISTSPLILADTSYPLKIAWGSSIPLSYIADQTGPQIVVFTPPMQIGLAKNENETPEIDELVEVGQIIEKIANSPMLQNANVSVIISGDLSHKHDENSQYGFHESSTIFDEKAVEWLKGPNKENWLELSEIHETAASCGIFGMGILLGVMDGDVSWTNKLLEYQCPTYFGMAISKWISVS